MEPAEDRERRRLYLRAITKLLAGIGLLFLLVPFVGSLPWPQAEIAANATRVEAATFEPGSTRAVTLLDGSTVLVTRSSETIATRLSTFPREHLWFPSAPGMADQDWFVFPARSALDEPLRIQPAAGDWPGGFVADSGAAWDVAGRALKPWPGRPGGSARKEQNLLPLPWRVVDDHLVLVPLPLP